MEKVDTGLKRSWLIFVIKLIKMSEVVETEREAVSEERSA
jgi:hypothetical protein